jgi:1-acyl-sn-glycerol-3-phosphate acyltransferase
MHVQPASLIYRAPQGRPENFYGWYGDMDFAPHLLQVLAAPRGGHVTLILHPAVAVADYPSRKDLAAACERIVRAGCFSTGAA